MLYGRYIWKGKMREGRRAAFSKWTRLYEAVVKDVHPYRSHFQQYSANGRKKLLYVDMKIPYLELLVFSRCSCVRLPVLEHFLR